jgi:SsrA-binding protein
MGKLIVKNNSAHFEYFIIEEFTAGLKLKGSEVKSIRKGNVNISEAYCYISNEEVFIKNMHVSEHAQGGKFNNHEPLRERKLLLKKKEILKLIEKTKQVGFTIIPISIILSNIGFIKLEIGLAKGKKLYDKRQSIKVKDLNRDLQQTLKNT